MMKKVLSVFSIVALLLLLLFSLASCGHGDDEHEFGVWYVDKEATCFEEGVEKRGCSCGEAETKTIPKREHIHSEWIIDKEATCTEDGSKHRICIFCGITVKTGVIAARGHYSDEWIIDKEPTCTEDGSGHWSCKNCGGISRILVIHANGHTDGEWIIDKEPTCIEDGSGHWNCKNCGGISRISVIHANGHTDGEWIIDKEATCTEDGSCHQVCTSCAATVATEVIGATGHNLTVNVLSKATAEMPCKVEHMCSACEYSAIESVGPIVVFATASATGVMITDGVYYYKSFSASATGGLGDYQYRFEAGGKVLQEYSSDPSITIYGNMFSIGDNTTVKITVKDKSGQKTVYTVRGDGACVSTYPLYE